MNKGEVLTDIVRKVENGKMDSTVAFDLILKLFDIREIKQFLLALRFAEDEKIRKEAQRLLGIYCR